MLAVYKMFRLLYNAGPKNAASLFSVKKNVYSGYSDAAMHVAEANVKAILAGEDVGLGAPLKDTSAFAMTTESLSADYPLYATSLFNLIRTSEARIDGREKDEKKNKLLRSSGPVGRGRPPGRLPCVRPPQATTKPPWRPFGPSWGLLSVVRWLISAR